MRFAGTTGEMGVGKARGAAWRGWGLKGFRLVEGVVVGVKPAVEICRNYR